jgi:hypothetical protein
MKVNFVLKENQSNINYPIEKVYDTKKDISTILRRFATENKLMYMGTDLENKYTKVAYTCKTHQDKQVIYEVTWN